MTKQTKKDILRLAETVAELLVIVKAQNEMLLATGQMTLTISKKIIEFENALERLEAKP